MRGWWCAMFLVTVGCGEATGGGDVFDAALGADATAELPGAADLGGSSLDGTVDLGAPDAPECATGSACDDGVDCTDDACVAGRCVHTPSPARCDDHVACTDDACGASGCAHTAVPARCMTGQTCTPMGCTGGRVCANDRDCADSEPCTVHERCDPASRVCRTDTLDGDGDDHPPRVCGGDDCDDGDPGVHPGATERCDGADQDCDGAVDDDARCGGVGESCQRGRCECAPATPSRCAWGACVDTATDRESCGACGVTCGALGSCAAGACRCAAGATNCGSTTGCVDTQGDVGHCGACFHACAPGLVCLRGACVCPGGGLACAGACVDAQTDARNCGACGNACPLEATCVAGRCQCAADRSPCGGRCVDVQRDAFNCGACGRVCMGDYDAGYVPERCVAGACRCEGGLVCPTPAGSRCVDVRRDPANCGRCGSACAPGTACVDGVCACVASGATLCGGRCVDLSSDDAHCGRCGSACAGSTWCSGGACRRTDASAACRGDDAECGALRCVGGYCLESCTPTDDAAAEARQCGASPRTVTCVGLRAAEGLCARRCTTRDGRGSLGACDVGTLCTGYWINQANGLPDTPGCAPFCASDSDCRDPASPFCNPRTGVCAARAVPSTARADGEPCDPTRGAGQCRGVCFQVSASDRTQGICGSEINLAVTPACPDEPSRVRPRSVAGDDLALCIFRDCARSSECTAPMVCVYPEVAGRVVTSGPSTCGYATALQPTGL